MGRRQRANEILNNLPQLQNHIKKDPTSYREEFLQQWKHFESSLGIFELKPDEEYKEFGDLIMFLAHVSPYYPKECQGYPVMLLNLLQKNYMVLDPNLRKSIVQSVILLRNKRQMSSTQLLPVFFTMFRCHDKTLRSTLYKYIVNDVRSANKGQHRDNKLNRVIQNYMFSIINSPDAQTKTSPGAIAAKKSLEVCIELYRRGIWNDSKTVNVIALGCFSKITKIKVTCIQFFLNPTKSKQRRLEKAQKIHKKNLKSRTEDNEENEDSDIEENFNKSDQPHFRVLSLINDPQNFAEKLFVSASSSSNNSKKGGQVVERFEVRLMQLKLVSRVMGYHNLYISSFFPFMQRYLQPHQRDITVILAIFATACNQFTAPESVQPQIRVIANNFVSDHCSPEVMSAGLNVIRAVCVRQPMALDDGLLSDLIEYRKHKDKGVMMAARSLLQFYRKSYPEMLPKRERGKSATEALIGGKTLANQEYGQEKVHEGVDGIDLLDMVSSDSELEFSGDESLEEESDVESIPEVQAGKPSKAKKINEKNIDEDSENDEIYLSDLGNDSDEDSDYEEEDAEENKEYNSENESDADDNEKANNSEKTEFKEADTSSSIERSNTEEEATEKEEMEESKSKVLRADMTRILTQEDFDKIDRMKKKQKEKARVEMESLANTKGKNKRSLETANSQAGDGENESLKKDYYDEADILGSYHSRKRAKATYAERMATVQAGREGREKFASKKSKRESDGRSTSNKEKRKTKNFKMISHKQGNVVKGKRSLVVKARELRAHIKKQKMKKH
ncbi:hypothetical protein BB561_001329 [Smittium simulii]|uniref:Protein SDA1 n=1 Tax=Smittium simulii TaxID=133385 RepID=A0A2T9YV33_9FUNG|nr:hypothetical protein BB561_001329 [Smittium simulii]